MESFWNERYSSPEYAYGTEPNAWLQYALHRIPPGRILLPADGEGRNSVYAATLGWEVHACDLSPVGKRKAEALADMCSVAIDYQVGDFSALSYPAASFTAIALIYAHFNPLVRAACHAKVDTLLAAGGHVILEAFSRSHPAWQERNPEIGGPRDPEMLYTTELIAGDFAGYDVVYLQEEEVHLEEGQGHRGTGSVVRFLARKR